MKAPPRSAPAFADALAPHYRDALRYCRALCADRTGDEADDLLQQSLLHALSGYHRLRDHGAFRSWLFRIITRCHRQSMRWLRTKHFISLDRAADGPHMPSAFEQAPSDASGIELLAALASLTPRDRATLLLFEVGGFDLEEIRVAQGDLTLSAVKSRLSRARARMRKLLLGQSPCRLVLGGPRSVAEAALSVIEALHET